MIHQPRPGLKYQNQLYMIVKNVSQKNINDSLFKMMDRLE